MSCTLGRPQICFVAKLPILLPFSNVLKLRVCEPGLAYVVLGTEARASRTLGMYSTNWPSPLKRALVLGCQKFGVCTKDCEKYNIPRSARTKRKIIPHSVRSSRKLPFCYSVSSSKNATSSSHSYRECVLPRMKSLWPVQKTPSFSDNLQPLQPSLLF